MNLEQPLESTPESVSPADEKRPAVYPRVSFLLTCLFFGAANDNILKQILMLMVVAGGLWANRLGPGTQGYISLVLTIPFVLLSGYAGQLADKFGKRDVILWVKIAEDPDRDLRSVGVVFGKLLAVAVCTASVGGSKFILRSGQVWNHPGRG